MSYATTYSNVLPRSEIYKPKICVKYNREKKFSKTKYNASDYYAIHSQFNIENEEKTYQCICVHMIMKACTLM